jgi:hypothetical protein
MKQRHHGAIVMKSPTVLSEFALRDCLRAAEADADRFHGGATPWAGRQAGAGRLLSIAAVTVLAIGAATWLVQSVSPGRRPGGRTDECANGARPVRSDTGA